MMNQADNEPRTARIRERLPVLQYLMDRYPEAEIPQQTVLAYCDDLADVPLDLLWAAVRRVVRVRRRFPPVATIFEAVTELHAEERSIGEPDEEWAWVVRWMADAGRGRETEGHELTERTVTLMGGWDRLGSGLESERAFRRNEFFGIYPTLLAREKLRWVTAEAEVFVDGERGPTYFERSGRMEAIVGSQLIKRILEGPAPAVKDADPAQEEEREDDREDG